MPRHTRRPNHLRKLRRVRQGRHRPRPQNRNRAVALWLQQGFARLRAPDTTRSFSSQIPFVVTLLGNLRRKRQLRSRFAGLRQKRSRHAHTRDTLSLQHGVTRPPTTSGSHLATVTLCPYQRTPVHDKCRLPRPLASRKSLTALRHVMPRGAGRCLRQSRDAIAKRDTTRRGTGAPCTMVHEALRVLTSPHRKRGTRPYACATTPRDSSQSRPAFRSAHTHPQQRYR